MKKLIALAVALIFLSVTGIAVAADITMSGDYFVRGSYQKNAEGAANDALQGPSSGVGVESGTMYYDHEFNLNATWNIDDNTSIITQFEMRDDSWGTDDPVEGTQFNGTAAPGTDSIAELDDNIIVEKVYLWHKFANGHELKAGLMPSGAWGTLFQDDESEAYRLRYDIPTTAARIIGIIQKVSEKGSMDNGQGESEDVDAYILGILTKAGNVNIKPLFVYKKAGNSSDVLQTNIAFDGTFGNIGFESEFGITDINYESAYTANNPTKKDSRTYGAYLNLWHAAGPVKAGILGAYGSYDDDASAAHSFGGDFDGGGAMIIGYDAGFNDSDNLAAGRLIALYADYAINDKLSMGGYAGFAKCGVDDGTKWDGAKAWELSADAAYKITDNLVYDCGAGVAQLKWGSSLADPDKAYRVYHRLTVNF